MVVANACKLAGMQPIQPIGVISSESKTGIVSCTSGGCKAGGGSISGIGSSHNFLARRQRSRRAIACTLHGYFQPARLPIEGCSAKLVRRIDRGGEEAVGHCHPVCQAVAADLCPSTGLVKQLESEIAGRIDWAASATAQIALVGEAGTQTRQRRPGLLPALMPG